MKVEIDGGNSMGDGSEAIFSPISQLRRRFRRAIVAAMYFVACLAFGVRIRKALLITAVLFILQLIALGTRRIAQAGLAFFMFAGVYWVAILPLPNGFIGPGKD